MARNFFKELKRCEEFICRDNAKYNDLQGNAKEYSLETKRAVYEIINLVEDCEFTSSKHTKFICENWMLDYKTLTAMWNRDNPNKIKAENTFRVQISTVCSHLYFLCGYDVFERLLKEDNIEDLVLTMRLKCDKDYKFNDFAIETISDCAVKTTAETVDYDIKELKNEIGVLKFFGKPFLYKLIDNIDTNKMAYIKGVLNKNLMLNSKRTINQKKMDILKAIESYSYIDFIKDFYEKRNPYEDTNDSDIVIDKTDNDANSSNESNEEIEKALEYYRKAQEIKNKYGILDCVELIDIAESSSDEDDSNKNIDRDVTKVIQFFKLFTEKQVKGFFSRVSSEDIKNALNSINKG